MRIRLVFKEVVDLELLGQGPSLKLVRILANLVFRTATGWTPVFSAIVDTGSPISVLPAAIWGLCHGERFAKTHMRGLVPKSDAVLGALYSRVVCSLIDEQLTSPPIRMRAFVAETSEVPLILGVADVLEQTSLWIDHRRQQAWLEF